MMRTRGAGVGLVLALALAWLAVEAAPRTVTAAGVLAERSICLDAGHGGGEPGAVYPYDGVDIEEQAINLDIALYLEGVFALDGASVTMTRRGDDTLSSRDRYSACNNAGSDILVSIHTNAASNQDIDGTLTIYFHNDDQVLAGYLQDSMYGSLLDGAPGAFTNFGLKKDALGVLLKSSMPAATVEPVMMSHDGELALLRAEIGSADCLDGCRRLEIAEAIHAGVLLYFDEVPPSGGGGGGEECKPSWHPKCAS